MRVSPRTGTAPKAPATPKTESKAKPTPEAEEKYALPVERSKPISSLSQAPIFFWGEKKIGKTLVASKFPEAFFFMFEPGGQGISIYEQPIGNWTEFRGYSKSVRDSSRFETLVIDTIDIAYARCQSYVCAREKITHPGDMPHGAGWDMVKREFNEQMELLMLSGRGIIFTSHAEIKDFQKPSGVVYNKLVPSAPTQARRFTAGVCSVIAYFGYYGDKRFITIEGSDTLEAGHRLEGRFIAKNGNPVHSIPMGKNAAEAYANLTKAFNNEQAVSGKPDLGTGLSDTRAKRTAKPR